MAISGTPVTVNTSYSNYWLEDLHIRSNPTGKTTAQAVLRPYTLDASNNVQVVPGVAPVVYTNSDLFTLAATDSELAEIISSLESKIQSLASAAKLI